MAFMIIYLVRVLIGPSIWDRLVGFSLISSKIILLIVVYASIMEINYYLDFAIAYALLGFICISFITIFLRGRLKEEK